MPTKLSEEELVVSNMTALTDAVIELVNNKYSVELVDNDMVIDEMTETNTTDWSVEEWTIDDICIIADESFRFSLEASLIFNVCGERMPDKMATPDTCTVKALLRINDRDQNSHFEVTSAELDWEDFAE